MKIISPKQRKQANFINDFLGLKEQRIRTFFRDSTIKYKLIKNPLIHGTLQEYILSYKDECEHPRATKHRCTHKYEQKCHANDYYSWA